MQAAALLDASTDEAARAAYERLVLAALADAADGSIATTASVAITLAEHVREFRG